MMITNEKYKDARCWVVRCDLCGRRLFAIRQQHTNLKDEPELDRIIDLVGSGTFAACQEHRFDVSKGKWIL